MEPIVIAGMARTPMGGFMGAFSRVSAPQLGSAAIGAALNYAGVAGDKVDQVVMGNVLPAGLGQAPARQAALADKTYEILSFLADVMDYRPAGVAYEGTVAYHDSCAGLRELGVAAQPRRLLEAVEGLSLVPLEGHDVCCGFGGTFCVKYPDISGAIVADKARCIAASGADTLLAGDLGCLMNMAGKLSRDGSPVKAYHTAEVLAGTAADSPPLCWPVAGGRRP